MKAFLLTLKSNSMAFLFATIAFIAPIKALILLVGLMISIDTIIGIYKAYKIKQKITSHRLSQVVTKMVLYQTSVITAFLLEKYLLGEFVVMFIAVPYFLTKILAIVLCYIEILSISESYEIVTGVNLWDKFKSLLTRVKEIKKDIEEVK